MGFLDTAKAAINVAGNITNALTDASIKDFYSLRDFYNFIRKDQNCPMAHSNFFTIVPEIPVPGAASFFSGISNVGDFFKKAWKSITDTANANDISSDNFQFNQYNLARFALAAQTISNLTSFGNTKQAKNCDSFFGKYTYQDIGGYLNSTGNTFTITFLQMAQPIIESFIIPWLIHMQKNNIEKNDQYGKINLLIKFYRTDEIAGLDFLMNPSFIYRITGVYPQSVTLVGPKHGTSDNNPRSVTFNYNNLMVYSNAEYQKFISGGKNGFQYDGLSPIQILNKLNSRYWFSIKYI